MDSQVHANTWDQGTEDEQISQVHSGVPSTTPVRSSIRQTPTGTPRLTSIGSVRASPAVRSVDEIRAILTALESERVSEHEHRYLQTPSRFELDGEVDYSRTHVSENIPEVNYIPNLCTLDHALELVALEQSVEEPTSPDVSSPSEECLLETHDISTETEGATIDGELHVEMLSSSAEATVNNILSDGRSFTRKRNLSKVERKSVFPNAPSSFLDVYGSVEEEQDSDNSQESSCSPSGVRNFLLNYWRTNFQLWVFLFLLALTNAVHAVTFEFFVNVLTSLLNSWILFQTDDSDWDEKVIWFGNYGLWILWSLFFSLVAASAVIFISPYAVGSGIPEMKVILSGIIVPPYLTIRTYFAKEIGTFCALVGGLTIGKVGPFVHISCIFANEILTYFPRLFDKLSRNDSLRLQILSFACSCGVAAAFGSVIGSVMFSMEVTATYYLVSTFWQSVASSCLTVFLVNMMGGISVPDMRVSSDIVNGETTFGQVQLLFIVAFGVVMALLVALFVRTLELAIKYNPAGPFWGSPRGKLCKTAIVAVCVAILAYPYPELRNGSSSVSYLFVDETLPSDRLLPLFAFFVLKFVTAVASVALAGVPCGVMMALFSLGAISGRFIGEVFYLFTPSLGLHPSMLAYVGAGAFAGGGTRAISTVIIVLEFTRNIYMLLPVSLASLVACGLGVYLSPSVYDIVLQLRGLPYIPHLYDNMRNKKASSVMSTSWHALCLDSTFSDVVDILEDANKQWSVPIIESDENPVFVGAVPRQKLEILVRNGLAHIHAGSANAAALQEKKMEPADNQQYFPTRAGFFSVEELLGCRVPFLFSSNPDEDFIRSDLDVFVDTAAFQLGPDTPLVKVHYVFSMLGLSHAYVTSKARLLGVITMQDLIELKRAS